MRLLMLKLLIISVFIFPLSSQFVFAQSSGYFQSQGATVDPSKILKDEMSNIRNSNAQLGTRITTAMEKLEEVARLTTEDEKQTQVDVLFITLREEIFSVLDQLGSNSDFSDALNRAKEGTIVLKKWYERQPPDYPSRDANISQLEQAIKEYDVVDVRLEESRNLAQEKLSTVIRQHRIIIQQMKIGKVLEAIASAQAVVESLNDITKAISVVEARTNESLSAPPIPN